MNEIDAVVNSDEIISRFLLQKRHFAATIGRVKYNALMPAPNGQTSVYRISGLFEAQIWQIGKEYVADPQQKELKARADIIAADINDGGLSIEPDQNPHERHANIIGWPEKKSKQMLIAEKIANKAMLRLKG